MDKFALVIMKWIVMPVAVGAIGYFVVGPRIGRTEGDAAQTQKMETEAPSTAETTSVAEPVATPNPIPATPKSAPKPDKVTKTKFDADVPQGEQSPSNEVGVSVDEKPQDPVQVKQATAEKAKAKPKAAKPKKTTDENGVAVFEPKPSKNKGDGGPGDDIKKMKPKSEKKPDLPATPDEPKEPVNGGGGEEGKGG